ncbi:FecCD family ABC transporter permease [Kosakonia oryzendophytica]|uniref:FecCD family ABC transporter permease n=1 Tax=Kosakonia oryzendophytica TaxID=1005665 RepID=UPI003D34515F
MSAVPLAARRRSWRTGMTFVVLLLLLLAAGIAHLGLGARYIAPPAVIRALVDFDARNFDHRVIVSLRLLRLVAALFTGAALGVAGALLQSVIRNPLGEPHILGLNAGAALAVVATTALGVSLGDSPFSRPLIAAGGAAALFSLVMALSAAGRAGFTPMKVTLCGVALSTFASSITAAILILDEQTLLSMRTWLAGDLAGLNWALIQHAAFAALAGFVLALWLSPSLNMLALGDNMARGLGVSLARTRVLSLLAIALLCGAAVSVAGPIGFIGLVVPHMVRRFAGDDLRAVVPLSALSGALLLLLADIAARMLLSPQELATGVMTALVGAPLFIALVARFFK